MFLFEIAVGRMSDIHLAMCELACKMIERTYGQLQQHALFRILSETKAELGRYPRRNHSFCKLIDFHAYISWFTVHTFRTNDELRVLNLPRYFNRPKAIRDLVLSMELLAKQSSEKILVLYKCSFLSHQTVASFALDSDDPYGKFYSILPKFRSNKRLNNNFNDLEINLLQNPAIDFLARMPHLNIENATMILKNYNSLVGGGVCDDKGQDSPKLELITLKSQHGYGIKYLLQYIDINSLAQRSCYHVDQQVNTNPIWIAGQSYQKSIYN